jgi:hypothetical protein
MDVSSTEKRKNARWVIGYFQHSARLKKLIINRVYPEAQRAIKQKWAKEANFSWQIFWARRCYSVMEPTGPG